MGNQISEFNKGLVALSAKYSDSFNKANKLFIEEQLKLDLDSIFDFSQMCNPENRNISQEKLDNLEKQLAVSKSFSDNHTQEYVKELNEIAQELPVDQQEDILSDASNKILAKAKKRYLVYELRCQWVMGTRELLDFIDANEDMITFDDEKITFESQEVLDAYEAIEIKIDQAGEAERQLHLELAAEQQKSRGILGALFRR